MINLHHLNTPNIGDQVCGPALYYPGFDQQDIGSAPNRDLKTIVVYGGGAIAGPAIRHANLQSYPTVFWGGGSTRRNQKTHPVPDYSVFQLAGTRDWGQGDWLPCVSCKHPAFDREYEIKHDVVHYGHRAVKPIMKSGVPYLDNEHPSFDEVISFLGSGSTVVTSSYHGMYWATLLKRNVIVDGFGSKFYYMPNLELSQCRELNDEFYQKVIKL